MRLPRLAVFVMLVSGFALSFAWADTSPNIVVNQLGVPREHARAVVIAQRKLARGDVQLEGDASASIRITKVARDPLLAAWIHTVEFTPRTDGDTTLAVRG